MNQLIEQVIQQILDDVGNNDLSAIEELLSFIPEENLRNFLPDNG